MTFKKNIFLRQIKATARTSTLILTAAFSVFAAYAGICYFLAKNHIKQPKLLAEPCTEETGKELYQPQDPMFIHKANYPDRIRKKEIKYNGFEFDLSKRDGRLYVAHNTEEISRNISLSDLLSAVSTPEKHNYWLDMKTVLDDKDIREIKNTVGKYGIPRSHFFFEPASDDNALALKKEGFSIVFPIFGFGRGEQTPEKTKVLIAQTEEKLKKIRPNAIATVIGQYPYLALYFPHYDKAVYYNTTKRPSLKKFFLKRFMKKDPKVSIFMTDEYDDIDL